MGDIDFWLCVNGNDGDFISNGAFTLSHEQLQNAHRMQGDDPSHLVKKILAAKMVLKLRDELDTDLTEVLKPYNDIGEDKIGEVSKDIVFLKDLQTMDHLPPEYKIALKRNHSEGYEDCIVSSDDPEGEERVYFYVRDPSSVRREGELYDTETRLAVTKMSHPRLSSSNLVLSGDLMGMISERMIPSQSPATAQVMDHAGHFYMIVRDNEMTNNELYKTLQDKVHDTGRTMDVKVIHYAGEEVLRNDNPFRIYHPDEFDKIPGGAGGDRGRHDRVVFLMDQMISAPAIAGGSTGRGGGRRRRRRKTKRRKTSRKTKRRRTKRRRTKRRKSR